ncbi:TonB-dependent receptor [Olivibacter sp. SDN3]|uniref:SusC/RagA family TonB-linked outer membrane protein n=1 Tax=Olivibacter sp. SDN3 TaxID=2764720 RepID=UPI001650DD7E|nr:TonB-dependent receptor [Olivibacter sp. SDN3]QNL51731.1 TonB-dependent receptor [Olivibacter sp. SDN3]
MKQKLLIKICCFLFFCVSNAFAQQKTVTGTVYGTEGSPLPGVSVVVMGTVQGTMTDADGHYSIEVAEGNSLVFSYIGMVSAQREVGPGITSIDIQLEAASSNLDEVIVVGYGTQSKRRLTDNIAKLSASDIAEIPSPAFQNTLAGKAAGVQVTQTNGKVEGGINIRIRGVASVGAGSQPLYVLDGMPLINSDESNNSAPQNPLLTLSPNEIESIDILKDASAAAIYGSRGANGVVLITTKRGKSGTSNISANVSHGFSSPTNKREWLNAAEYVELIGESLRNRYGEEDGTERLESFLDYYSAGTDWRNGEVDTDWQSEALRNGYVTDGDLAFSGGNEKTSYFFSGAYNNTKGIIRGNDLDRITSRANVSHKFSDKFTAGANLSFSRTTIDRIANDNAFVTPMQAVALSPISPAYLPDGEPNGNTVYANFLLHDKYAFYRTNIRRVTGKAFGEYRFLPELKFNTDFGYDLYYQTEDNYTGRLAPFQSTNGEGYASSVGTESYITSNYFTFSKNFNSVHDLEVVAGMEYNDTRRRFQSVTGIQFPSDDFQTIDGAAEITAGSGSNTGYSFLSYFARGTYAFNDKYLLKASVRRDGSSRFGRNYRYGTFSAVSAGWILSEENFLKDSQTLSFLKLRASWGQSGNAEIDDFASRALFNAVTYNQRPGIAPIQAANPFLTWESVDQYDVGVEYGFLDNRISGEIDYYVKQSDGLLFDVPLPGTSGIRTLTQNIGLMENKGWEFVVNTENVAKDDFKWNTSFNISNNRNRIKELPNGVDVITGQNILRENEVLNAFYLVEYAGVDPANGDALYYLNSDNGDGTINRETTNSFNAANRIVAGSPIPNWIGGLTNTMQYKAFDFSFTFQGEWGASIYNSGGVYQSANGDYYDNQSRDQLRRWQNPGDITDVPQARFGLGNGAVNSTRYLQKANFIRLRNLNLGYTIPRSATERIGVKTLRVYFTAFNLLTFTNYDGYDPEARSDADGTNPAGTSVARGLDFYSAPAAKTYSFGVNIGF